MPIGLLAIPNARLSFLIATNQVDFDLYAALGSPTYPVNVTVLINAGIVISSSDPAVPAFSGTSLNANSNIYLINHGRIIGAGGAGADGGYTSGARFGAGGGGAGAIVGPGGENLIGIPSSVDGSDGTTLTGGAGGTSAFGAFGGGSVSETTPTSGGDAISIGCDISIDNTATGELFGGGGGGAAANASDPTTGGTGGDIGEQGYSGDDTAQTGGVAGYAVRHTGHTLTQVAGFGASQVKGTVG